jgi:homoserine trans-succinylase
MPKRIIPLSDMQVVKVKSQSKQVTLFFSVWLSFRAYKHKTPHSLEQRDSCNQP